MVGVRVRASIVGQVVSMSLAIGSVTRLRTKALYHVVNNRQFWSDKLPHSVDACKELSFWKPSLQAFNGWPVWFFPGVTCIVFSDGSSSGYSSCSVVHSQLLCLVPPGDSLKQH